MLRIDLSSRGALRGRLRRLAPPAIAGAEQARNRALELPTSGALRSSSNGRGTSGDPAAARPQRGGTASPEPPASALRARTEPAMARASTGPSSSPPSEHCDRIPTVAALAAFGVSPRRRRGTFARGRGGTRRGRRGARPRARRALTRADNARRSTDLRRRPASIVASAPGPPGGARLRPGIAPRKARAAANSRGYGPRIARATRRGARIMITGDVDGDVSDSLASASPWQSTSPSRPTSTSTTVRSHAGQSRSTLRVSDPPSDRSC